MGMNRAWRYRLYPSKVQQQKLNHYLYECKDLWNFLLEHTKMHYKKTRKFPTRKELYLLTKEKGIFSQVAQNVAYRLTNSLKRYAAKKKAEKNVGFPRFKQIDRMKSFTYPQFGFKLEEKLELSDIGNITIKKHRSIKGKIKTLTIKKTPSGKWFDIFTSEIKQVAITKKQIVAVGIDLGIERFASLSDGTIIANPRNFKRVERRLAKIQRQFSKKKKGSKNKRKARIKVAITYEKLTNRRRDFLHKSSRELANNYSLIAIEKLDVTALSKGFLARHVLDCSWAEFSSMLQYKAEEAGSEVILVDPAQTSSNCSGCGLIQKKTLAERWHECSCGFSMHRDLNAARNILKRAISRSIDRPQNSCKYKFLSTAGTVGSNACGEETSTYYKPNGQVSSRKQEA